MLSVLMLPALSDHPKEWLSHIPCLLCLNFTPAGQYKLCFGGLPGQTLGPEMFALQLQC